MNVGQSQVGRALTGEVGSGVGARLAVMMVEEGASMAWAQARGCQRGGTFQGLTVRGLTALGQRIISPGGGECPGVWVSAQAVQIKAGHRKA